MPRLVGSRRLSLLRPQWEPDRNMQEGLPHRGPRCWALCGLPEKSFKFYSRDVYFPEPVVFNLFHLTAHVNY